MAFVRDWTPLTTVYEEFERKGRGMAQTKGFELALEQKRQSLAERELAVRERNLDEQSTEADRAFRLQLAASRQREQSLNIQAERARSAGSREAGKLLEEKTQVAEDLGVWDKLRPSMSQQEYLRGLIEIRNGRRPPKLEQAKGMSAVEQLEGLTDALNELGRGDIGIMPPASPGEPYTIDGYYKDADGGWRQNISWRPDKKVKDAATIQRLNKVQATLGTINQRLPEVQGMAIGEMLGQSNATPEPSMTAEQDQAVFMQEMNAVQAEGRFDTIMAQATPEQRQKLQLMQSRGWSKQQILEALEEN